MKGREFVELPNDTRADIEVTMHINGKIYGTRFFISKGPELQYEKAQRIKNIVNDYITQPMTDKLLSIWKPSKPGDNDEN